MVSLNQAECLPTHMVNNQEVLGNQVNQDNQALLVSNLELIPNNTSIKCLK
jgi:hypothetical protein